MVAIRDWLRKLVSGPIAAGQLKKIRESAQRLREHPAIGPGVGGDMRKLGVRQTPYIIYYEIAAPVVRILRVRHGREDRPLL